MLHTGHLKNIFFIKKTVKNKYLYVVLFDFVLGHLLQSLLLFGIKLNYIVSSLISKDLLVYQQTLSSHFN